MRWLAPVALAVVFAWAGGAKFADLKGTQEGFAALGLLTVFTVLLVRLLRAGATAPCRCFGGIRSHPIAWTDIARNVALGALAVVILVAPPA